MLWELIGPYLKSTVRSLLEGVAFILRVFIPEDVTGMAAGPVAVVLATVALGFIAPWSAFGHPPEGVYLAQGFGIFLGIILSLGAFIITCVRATDIASWIEEPKE